MESFREVSKEGIISTQYVPDAPRVLINADDILAITVSTFDSTAAKVFNANVATAGADGSFIGKGYLVDEDGQIDFPLLGRLKLGGLTRDMAKDTIKTQLLTYLRDPVVDVRFLNLHVSVMGEVRRPGIYTFPDERFTVLEALTMAGDMTDFADREDILVIREVGKVREFGRLDLSSARAFESPYFYLTQNDVLYIRPLREKVRVLGDPVSRALAFTGLATSVLTLIVTLNR